MPELHELPWDAIVLGAGISGLISASLLCRQGLRRVLVIDEYDTVGGNHICCDIGPYTFDVGCFTFADNSAIIKHFPGLLHRYLSVSKLAERIAPDGKLRKYPFSFRDEVVAAGTSEWIAVLASILLSRLFIDRITNADEFARYWLGRRIYERSGLANYIERFHGAKPWEIDGVFAEKRMAFVSNGASVRKRIAKMFQVRRSQKSLRPVQTLIRPRDGFPKLYDEAVQDLESSGVTFCLGVRMHSVTRNGSCLQIETDTLQATSPRVIATIPLTRTLQLCRLRDNGAMPTVTLISLFLTFKGKRGFSSNILYNFSRNGEWKRLTMYSDFYGSVEGREYFTAEVNLVESERSGQAEEEIRILFENFQADVASKGLFTGQLTLEGSHVLQNGYPIYRKGAAEAAAEAIRSLNDFGVESFGRQGGFDYLPSVASVASVVEEKLRMPGRPAK